MDQLQKQILNYVPQNRREAADKALILRCMETFKDTLTRENTICHFTASSWVVNAERTKALMIYHNIEQMWMWTGGHADGEADLLAVALREASEETGLSSVRPLIGDVFDLEVFGVPPHVRRGEFVSSHLHLNCGFLLEADENEVFRAKPDENSGVCWIDFEEIIEKSKEGSMSPHYPGLIERVRKY